MKNATVVSNKHSNKSNKAPVQMTEIPETPFQKIQVDFAGPFGQAQTYSFRYVLQIQDILTRFIGLIPTISNTSEEAADAILEKWVCTHASCCHP